ncbi:MAG: hypothetical protein HYY25_13440 [Candidatus Wallbacteria bacterium]|nr:hypothetical protein [Candidatus Wallbacteria bacterium]
MTSTVLSECRRRRLTALTGIAGGTVFTFTRPVATGDDGSFTISLTTADAAGNAFAVQPLTRTFSVQPSPPPLLVMRILNIDGVLASPNQAEPDQTVDLTARLTNLGSSTSTVRGVTFRVSDGLEGLEFQPGDDFPSSRGSRSERPGPGVAKHGSRWLCRTQ